MFGGRVLEVFLDGAALDDLRVVELAGEVPVAGDAAFFVDEEHELLAGRRTFARHEKEVGRLHPAAATGAHQSRCERAHPREAPHASTAAPPRRGSPAPLRAPSRRRAAWTPPK